MSYNLSNKCTKNFCTRKVLVQLIVEDVITCFLTQCISLVNFSFVWYSSTVLGPSNYTTSNVPPFSGMSS